MELEAEEELDVLQLLWVALNERLAVLGAAEGTNGVRSESEEDSRRRRMADVLRASEKHIVDAHSDNVKQRIAFLLASVGAEEGDDDGEEEEQYEAQQDEQDIASVSVEYKHKSVLKGKRHR